MTRLAVGFDARPALFGRTGFGRAARELMRALQRRDDLDVRGFGVAWRRAAPDLEPLPGVVTRRLPARLVSAVARFGVGAESWLGELDVYQHTDLVFAPVRAAPEVLLLHDVLFLREPKWFAPGFVRGVMQRLRPRLAAATAVVVPSQRTADDLLHHELVPAPRLHVVPLGCDHVDPTPRPDDRQRVSRLFQRGGRPPLLPDQLVVLVPGTREPRKNQHALLEQFLRQRDPHDDARSHDDAGRVPWRFRMLLVGPRGWGCPALEAALDDAWASERVTAAGAVAEEDLHAALRVADVVAFPSFAEGFGLPVAEALRCGRPVLTSLDTPMADFGGDAVLAVDPRDEEALWYGLKSLLNEPERRAELAAAGPTAVAPLTWDAMAEACAAIYHSVAGAR